MVDVTAPSRPLDTNVTLVWRRRAWDVVPVGCCLCIEDNEPSTISSYDGKGRQAFHCVTHGALREVVFSIIKRYMLRLDGISRQGVDRMMDTLLVPASLSETERRALLIRILDEATDEEAAKGT